MSTTDVTLPEKMQRWTKLIDDLIAQVNAWAKQRDWSTRLIQTRIDDVEFGTHLAPALLMQKETARILLQPISRETHRVDAYVDLYLLPAYDDIARLYHDPDGWKMLEMDAREPSGKSDRDPSSVPFTEETFADVVELMVRNALITD